MTTCSWPLGDSNVLNFHVYDKNEEWKALAGLYIFTYQASDGLWIPLYVGQTNDFSARLPSHERLDEAVRNGATHIHALAVPLQANRDSWEEKLIQYLQPPMNQQLRHGLTARGFAPRN